LLDGKRLAKEIRADLLREVQAQFKEKAPGLAVVLVGDNHASHSYVRSKQAACLKVGINSFVDRFPADISEEVLIAHIHTLNQKEAVNGILVQLPLPATIDKQKVLESVDPEKDVDGLHPYNLGRLVSKSPILHPCTPLGVIHLLRSTGEVLEGKKAVVVGASPLVGRPMALELLLEHCTVTVCHSHTRNLAQEVGQAEILISAVGQPQMIRGGWIKEGAIVIDVGMSRSEEEKWQGDVEFETAKARASFITPVPGGVGPMTVAMLLKNTVRAAKWQEEVQESHSRRR